MRGRLNEDHLKKRSRAAESGHAATRVHEDADERVPRDHADERAISDLGIPQTVANEFRIGIASGAMIVAAVLGVVGLTTQRAAFATAMFAVALVAAIALLLLVLVSRRPRRKRRRLG